MARSVSGISAIFASRSLSPSAFFLFARSSAFGSLARSLIAARSSAVNPSDFFRLLVPSCAGSAVSYSVRQEEVYSRPRTLASRFLIGPVTRLGGVRESAREARSPASAAALIEAGAVRRHADPRPLPTDGRDRPHRRCE